MKMVSIRSILFICLFISTVNAQIGKISKQNLTKHRAAESKITAIKGVHVIPMDSERIMYNQTVLIRDKNIEQIGNETDIIIPPNAFLTDGRNKYLVPGLIDMHVHISDENDLLLLLVNGVTSVRNMADLPGWVKTFMGFPDVLELKQDVSSGRLIGPDIYTAGLVLDGVDPVSPFNEVVEKSEDAAKEVRRQKKKGYDYIKIYDMLSVDGFNAIVKEASENQLPVIGHVPLQVGIDRVLASNVLSIEHLTGYIYNNKADFVIPREQIHDYAKKTKKSGIWNCPSLVIYDKLPSRNQFDSLKNCPEYQYLSWRVKWLWKTTMKYVYDNEYKGSDYPAHMMSLSKEMTAALHDAGCPLLVGTDMNFLSVFPGVSTQRELCLLTEAGLTPYEALQAGTYNAAKCLQRLDKIGTVTEGKQADLILLEKNPLDNVNNIAQISAVITKGIWIDKTDIDEILEKLK